MISPVFIDTVGLIAIWDRTDKWHAAASTVYSGLKADLTPMISTSYVLLECGNAAARKPFRNSADRVRIRLVETDGLIVPSETDWNMAWDAYGRGEAGDAGIVDQVSFIVMRRLGITRAFTNDQHFRAAGFETLF